MLDFAHQMLSSTDLSILNPSVIDITNHLQSNIADIHLNVDMNLLAQQFKQDVMGDVGKGWDEFVKTGRIWALIIGVVVGYLFRSITNA